MLKPNLMSNLKRRTKVNEKSKTKLSISTSNLELSSELRSTKNLKLSLSPYASNSVQFKSFDKPLDTHLSKHLKYNAKDKFIPLKNNHQKIISLSSLLSEKRKPPLATSKLCKTLEKRLKTCCESVEYADVYFDIFEEVINHCKDFGSTLKQLKSALSSIIKAQKIDREYLKKTVENLEMLNKSQQSECLKLNNMNEDLQRKVQEAHQNYTDVSDKYLKIMKTTVDENELNYENFLSLKHKNFVYQDLVFTLKDEVGFYKRKSKKFCRLYNILEGKGIPVEEIYLTEMKKEKILPNYFGESGAESNTDNEYLESKRGRFVVKKGEIPTLRLDDLPRESDSSSDDSSASESDRLIEF